MNKTNFHMKGFALGLALKQRRKATRKSPIACVAKIVTEKDELANFSGTRLLTRDRSVTFTIAPRPLSALTCKSGL